MRMSAIREDLEARGIVVFPSQETRSILVMRASDRPECAGSVDWKHVFSAPEVFVSDDDLAAHDYKEIVLRKVTSALGHVPRQ
jgi:sulfur transfer complex TusBCD TusB component (DsrH family)